MQKHDRRALSPTRDELAELVAVKDPNPPKLPEDVVKLLRRAGAGQNPGKGRRGRQDEHYIAGRQRGAHEDARQIPELDSAVEQHAED